MPKTTHTYTYAVLQVPQEVYDLIRERLERAGYKDQIDGENNIIDMHGIGLEAEKSGAGDDDGEATVSAEG